MQILITQLKFISSIEMKNMKKTFFVIDAGIEKTNSFKRNDSHYFYVWLESEIIKIWCA